MAGINRSFNLFIKDYKNVAVCFPIVNLKTQNKHLKKCWFTILNEDSKQNDLKHKKFGSKNFYNSMKLRSVVYSSINANLHKIWK